MQKLFELLNALELDLLYQAVEDQRCGKKIAAAVEAQCSSLADELTTHLSGYDNSEELMERLVVSLATKHVHEVLPNDKKLEEKTNLLAQIFRNQSEQPQEEIQQDKWSNAYHQIVQIWIAAENIIKIGPEICSQRSRFFDMVDKLVDLVDKKNSHDAVLAFRQLGELLKQLYPNKNQEEINQEFDTKNLCYRQLFQTLNSDNVLVDNKELLSACAWFLDKCDEWARISECASLTPINAGIEVLKRLIGKDRLAEATKFSKIKMPFVQNALDVIMSGLLKAFDPQHFSPTDAVFFLTQLGELPHREVPEQSVARFRQYLAAIRSYKGFLNNETKPVFLAALNLINHLHLSSNTNNVQSSVLNCLQQGISSFKRLVGYDFDIQVVSVSADAKQDDETLKELKRFMAEDFIPNTLLRRKQENYNHQIFVRGKMLVEETTQIAAFTVGNIFRQETNNFFKNPNKTMQDSQRLQNLSENQQVKASTAVLNSHRSHKVLRAIRKFLVGLFSICTGGLFALAKASYSLKTTGRFTLFADNTRSWGAVLKAEDKAKEIATKTVSARSHCH